MPGSSMLLHHLAEEICISRQMLAAAQWKAAAAADMEAILTHSSSLAFDRLLEERVALRSQELVLVQVFFGSPDAYIREALGVPAAALRCA